MNQGIRVLWYLGCVGLLALASFGMAQAEMLLNQSFETNIRESLANNWSRQNFDSGTSRFFREQRRDYVRHGDSAQKIVFRKDASVEGSMQFHQVLSLDKGKLYRFSFWIRTDPGAAVRIQAQAKQTMGAVYGGRYFDVTQDYQKVDFLVATRDNDLPSVRCGFQVKDDAVLYIDNASLEEVSGENGFAFDSLPLSTKTIPPEFFGIEYRNRGKHDDRFADINQGLVRIWGKYAGWGHIQPNDADDWNFNAIEAQLDYIETYTPDAKVLLKLGMAPSWATGVTYDKDVAWGGDEYKGANHMVLDTDDWVNYVEEVVSRYDGEDGRREIHYYEIWNEVNHKEFWKGGMENMLTLAKLAYEKIKEINPDAKVLLPNFTVSGHHAIDEYLSLLSQSGGVYADLADIHIYYGNMTPELTINNALVFKEHLERWGIDLPVWNTEGSAQWDSTGPLPSPEAAMGAVARGYILNWAYGHENFMWFFWSNEEDGYGVPLVETDWETLTPGGEAYKKVVEWLTGARMTDTDLDANGNYIVAIDNPEDMFRGYIVWRTSGASSFTPDPSWDIGQWTPLSGTEIPYRGGSVPVGVEPILLEARHYLVPRQWYSLESAGHNHRKLQSLGLGQSNNVKTAPASASGDWVRWRFIPAPDGGYYIENHEGRLQALGSPGRYNVRTISSSVTGDSVRWRLVPNADSGNFFLENVWLNRRLRANSGKATPKYNVHSMTNSVTGLWVQWRFVPQF
jgi:hypothetical protein